MIYFVVALVILLLIIVTYSKSPRGKGAIGENRVKAVLGKDIIDQKYVINNLTVLYEGKSSQIDHVIISKTGIFVIETKNYAGQIYGQENQHEWTQVLSYGNVKNKFYNPIKQNKSHIYALGKVLGRTDGFVSIIVFPKAELRTETTTPVGNLNILREIYNEHKEVIFSSPEVNEMYNKLLHLKNNPEVSNRDHLANIKQMRKNLDNNICPRCGKTLVLKSGKYGQFNGCSDYPRCKFKMTA